MQGEKDNLSVHLTNWPDVSGIKYDAGLVEKMDLLQQICSQVLSIRKACQIRTRLPLAKLQVIAVEAKKLEEFASIIMDEINVKQVEFLADMDKYASRGIKINFKECGKKLGADLQKAIAAGKSGDWEELSDGNFRVGGFNLTRNEAEVELVPLTAGENKAKIGNSFLLILDTEITKELEQEGVARDLVRFLQQSRKEANFVINDYVDLTIVTEDSGLSAAINNFDDYIKKQVLIRNLSLANQKSGKEFSFEGEIDGIKFTVEFVR